MADNARATAVHNATAGEVVRRIVAPVIEAGGTSTDIMVLTESVLVGVALMVIHLGGDELVLDVMVAGAKQRLAEIRLGGLEPSGSA